MEPIDNLEGGNNTPPIETPEKDNSQANTDELTKERRKQQLDGSKQEAERQSRITDEVIKATKDAGSLLELHGQDPKLAEEVAKKFGFDSYESAVSSVNGTPPEEDDFDKKYEAKRTKEVHQESLRKAETFINKLDEDKQEQVKSYFDKITKGKQLDSESAIEFVEMATLYVSRSEIKEGRFSEGLSKLSSTGLGSSKKVTPVEEKRIVNSQTGDLVLDSNKQK